MTKKRGYKEGSIWQERKKWRAAVRIDGKRITRSFSTKTECKTWIREIQIEIARGVSYGSTNITIETFIKQWFEIHKTKLAPRTAIRYEQLVRDYILPQLGNIKLRELKLVRVEQHYQSLLQKGLSSRSVRFVHSILHRSLNDAIRRGLTGYNAAHGAILPRYEAKEMAILDENEVMQFLIAVKGNRHEALFHMAIKTGMRQGELLGLKWMDLDWNKGIIRVQRQVQRIPRQGLVFRPPKTKAGQRAIQLGEFLLQQLQSHLEQQANDKVIAGKLWQDNDLIFASKVGTPLSSTNLLKDFKLLLEIAGVKKIRFHDLRHTAASLMLNHGVPVLVVSKILGHSKTSTTLDIYGHIFPIMQAESARIMDEIVTPISVQMGEKENVETSA